MYLIEIIVGHEEEYNRGQSFYWNGSNWTHDKTGAKYYDSRNTVRDLAKKLFSSKLLSDKLYIVKANYVNDPNATKQQVRKGY